jgi:predicted nucleic acid-binding protein
MRLVVADTGPLNYLVLIGHIELLPKLFGRMLIAQAARDELADRDTPTVVRAWIAQALGWLEIRPKPDRDSGDGMTAALDEGQQATIALAVAVKADLVLMDDREGVAVARRKGLAVTGTLGVLDLAARRGMLRRARRSVLPGNRDHRLPQERRYPRKGSRDGEAMTSKNTIGKARAYCAGEGVFKTADRVLTPHRQ